MPRLLSPPLLRPILANPRLRARLLEPFLFVLLASGLLLASPASAQALPPPPDAGLAIVFDGGDPGAVAVTGLPAGGRVVLFSVARGHNGFVPTIARRETLLADDDGDGAVRFSLPGPVPEHSVWAAVELAGGAWALGAPGGRAQFLAAPLAAGLAADSTSFREARRWVETLWVRPGTGRDAGIWGGATGDGGATDGDGVEDLAVEVRFADLTPRGETTAGPPESFGPGDVRVVVDVDTLEVYAERAAAGGVR